MRLAHGLLRVGVLAGACILPIVAQTSSDPRSASPPAATAPASPQAGTTTAPDTNANNNYGDRDRDHGFNFGWLGLVGLAGLLGLRHRSSYDDRTSGTIGRDTMGGRDTMTR